MSISSYLNHTAYIVTKTTISLYNSTSSGTLTITATPPTVDYRCRVTLTSVTGHTDCVGTVTVDGEVLTFTACNQKKIGTTTIDANTRPTITTANIDCNVFVECIDLGGVDIKYETTSSFPCRFSEKSHRVLDSTGAWTSKKSTVCFTTSSSPNVGSIIRYGSIDYMVSDVLIRTGKDGIEDFRTIIF